MRGTSGRALITSALFVCLAGLLGCTQPSSLAEADCRVTRFDDTASVEAVFDGDTLRLKDQRVVRLIGINTPEMGGRHQPPQPLADAARKRLTSLLGRNARVGLVYDEQRHDRHQRTLAHVYLLGQGEASTAANLSELLLADGLGFAITVPPNIQFQRCYFRAEALARTHQLGVWRHHAYQPISAQALRPSDTGFQYVHGTITNIGQARKSVWLDLGEGTAIRIRRRDLQYFDDLPIEALQGRSIRVRGWFAFYNNKLRVTIGHPSMLEVMD